MSTDPKPDWTPKLEDFQRAYSALNEILAICGTEQYSHDDAPKLKKRLAVIAKKGMPR